MNDEDRKILTEYLGECWDATHTNTPKDCNRTFLTGDDMLALMVKVSQTHYVEINLWPDENVISIVPLKDAGYIDEGLKSSRNILAKTVKEVPLRFAELVARAIREKIL